MAKYISIVLLCLVLVFASGCQSTPEPVVAQDTSALSATTDPVVTDTDTPTDTATEAPDQTIDPQPTDSPDADATDSPQPDDSSTLAPTDTAQPDDTSSAEPTDTNAPSADAPQTIAVKAVEGKANVDSYLPLRASASSTADTLIKIPKDDTFTIVDVEKDTAWLKVKYSGKTGYVSAKYVTIGSSAANHVCTITSTSTVNVRSGAGKKFKILGVVASGKLIIVTDQVTVSPDKWCKVVIGKVTGYIDAQFCRVSGS